MIWHLNCRHFNDQFLLWRFFFLTWSLGRLVNSDVPHRKNVPGVSAFERNVWGRFVEPLFGIRIPTASLTHSGLVSDWKATVTRNSAFGAAVIESSSWYWARIFLLTLLTQYILTVFGACLSLRGYKEAFPHKHREVYNTLPSDSRGLQTIPSSPNTACLH